MSSKKQGALFNRAIKDNQDEQVKASTAVQAYVKFILQQPDLKLSALPDLPAYQATARNHANNWNDTILPLMSKTDADIIDYANMFDSFYDDLVKYAQDIKNPTSKESLIEGLNLLGSAIKQKYANVQVVVKDLSTFAKNLNTDTENFRSVAEEAAVKITGDNGELQSLKAEIDAIHEAMHKDISLMAGGAAMAVAGVAMIVFGALLEIPSGGTTTALIGGGVLLYSGSAAMETIGSADYSSQIDQLKLKEEQLKDEKIELVGLQNAQHQVSGFQLKSTSAVTAADNLKDAWQALDADLEELITAIKDVDPNLPPDWLLDELQNAKLDWKDARDKALKLQPDGKLPTKFFENVQEAFKQAKPPGQA